MLSVNCFLHANFVIKYRVYIRGLHGTQYIKSYKVEYKEAPGQYRQLLLSTQSQNHSPKQNGFVHLELTS